MVALGAQKAGQLSCSFIWIITLMS
jgi:hypothetical protein